MEHYQIMLQAHRQFSSFFAPATGQFEFLPLKLSPYEIFLYYEGMSFLLLYHVLYYLSWSKEEELCCLEVFPLDFLHWYTNEKSHAVGIIFLHNIQKYYETLVNLLISHLKYHTCMHICKSKSTVYLLFFSMK